MKRGLALLLLLGAAAPAAASAAPARRLFTIGDSLARDNRPYLRHQLPRWKIEDDFSFARSVRETADDLRVRSHAGAPLPPVINVSSGTGDDPDHPDRFRHAIHALMRVAGPHRCVVWANIWRLRLEQPTLDVLNSVLAEEDAVRRNLRVSDWNSMVDANPDWLVDPVHVNDEGNRARARAVAHEVRACRRSLEPPPPLPGPLPAGL